MRSGLGTLAAVALLLFAPSPPARPNGAPEGVGRANGLYDAGKYRESAEEYGKLLQGPLTRAGGERSAETLYNLGDALYRVGDYARAHDSFEQAAVMTRVLDVEARATYNMGNCSFREAEAAVAKGGLQQALQSLEAAIAAYRRSLELEPTRRAAATNLEVARTLWKGVRDELAKSAGIQDLQREIIETLKRLVTTQDALIGSRGNPDVSTAKLKDGQELLRGDTRSLLDRMDTLLQILARLQGGFGTANPVSEARRHVQSSEGHQGRALEALGTGNRGGAASPQKSSLEELQKALELLSPPPREDRSQQGDGQSGSGQAKDSPPSAQSGQSGSNDRQPTEPQQDQGPPGGNQSMSSGDGGAGALERADDILQEEGDKRRVRDAQIRSGPTPVDRDW